MATHCRSPAPGRPMCPACAASKTSRGEASPTSSQSWGLFGVIADVFRGDVQCTLSAWIMEGFLMVRVRAGAEVGASPSGLFSEPFLPALTPMTFILGSKAVATLFDAEPADSTCVDG